MAQRKKVKNVRCRIGFHKWRQQEWEPASFGGVPPTLAALCAIYDNIAVMTMTIIGIGTDIIECERISRMVEKHSDHFVNRVFTEAEVRYCSERRSGDQHFAGRWAAKEAVLKALGTGWIAGIAW